MSDSKPELSKRQAAVLALLAQGNEDAAIGERLNIRPRTVRFHVDEAKKVLGARNRMNLLVLAVRHGAVTAEQLLSSVDAQEKAANP